MCRPLWIIPGGKGMGPIDEGMVEERRYFQMNT